MATKTIGEAERRASCTSGKVKPHTSVSESRMR
jgi:hypothetical protein